MMPFYKALLVLSLATAGSIQSQTFSTLYSFPSAPVSYYPSTRVQGIDGSLYGTTSYGGLTNQGTVFKITPGGTLTTLHNFSGTDGSLPVAMIEGTEGNFYGVTEEGSAGGTVFKITPEGALTTLHSFPGDTPLYLIQGADADFYGTTSDTVFKMTLSGTLTTLHTFTGNAAGWSLMQATNGDFYGTSLITGVGNCCGTLFKLTPSGKYTLLHTFSEAGTYPYAAMVQALNGNLYGTTSYGGTYNNGTIYELTPPGVFTTVHNFTNAEGLVGTGAALIQATSGKLYGTTYYNGVYEFTLNGTLTTVPGFSQQSGQGSCGGLVQATNGVFYGTTCFGGTQNTGVVFSLSQNLAPFVEPLPGLGAEVRP
jgi:uncharacterized repeat protein (TIGR03803 family)